MEEWRETDTTVESLSVALSTRVVHKESPALFTSCWAWLFQRPDRNEIVPSRESVFGFGPLRIKQMVNG